MNRFISTVSTGRMAGCYPRLVCLVEWSLAAPVLALTALGLIQFGWLLVTAQTLHGAADAAIREATLPRATGQTIAAAARRHLTGLDLARKIDPIVIRINGRPARRSIRPQPGDEVVVGLTVPASSAAPDLLRPLGILPAGRQLRSRRAVRIR